MRRSTAGDVKKVLAQVADPERAKGSAWFFKTGPGQYGEGDKFIGVRVPDLRRAALRHIDLPREEAAKLLASEIHEHRLAALEILVAQFEGGESAEQGEIYRFYLSHTGRINNWDLVDASAPYIVGPYLLARSTRPLFRLAASKNIWERRIGIVATFAFIRNKQTEITFAIAQKLLADKHDLIHKAVGWALREAGKVSNDLLVGFLEANYRAMPRTTLRYAIERFPADERARMLRGIFV